MSFTELHFTHAGFSCHILNDPDLRVCDVEIPDFHPAHGIIPGDWLDFSVESILAGRQSLPTREELIAIDRLNKMLRFLPRCFRAGNYFKKPNGWTLTFETASIIELADSETRQVAEQLSAMLTANE